MTELEKPYTVEEA